MLVSGRLFDVYNTFFKKKITPVIYPGSRGTCQTFMKRILRLRITNVNHTVLSHMRFEPTTPRTAESGAGGRLGFYVIRAVKKICMTEP